MIEGSWDDFIPVDYRLNGSIEVMLAYTQISME